MLYLFNSAYRPLYLRNVMNTLYLPKGYGNEYRYKFTAPFPNISEDVRAAMSHLTKRSDCLVTFIDRYAPGGYQYHPLRRAKFLAYREEGQYAYFKVALQEFLSP